MSDGLFSSVEMSDGERVGYRLARIEIYNWGTFDSHVWQLVMNGETSLLTGDIGSGKSTLVDALTTLLRPSHKISYNKAAGAGTRERDLRSYVEGHYKSERIETTGQSRPVGLRPGGETYSVILGVFTNEGYDDAVTLAQVFQQRDAHAQPYRFYVTADKALSVAGDFADFGSNLNDLRKKLRTLGADIFNEFPPYDTKLRRLLGIESAQALELFQQTVSMKSVGNLDEFVSRHMLEPVDASARVDKVLQHYENLTRAHEAVRRAREQLELLDPIKRSAQRYDEAVAQRTDVEYARDAAGLYISELRLRLLAGEISEITTEAARLQAQQERINVRQAELGRRRDMLIEERASAGGSRIGELERLTKEALAQAESRRSGYARFESAVTEAGLERAADFTAESFDVLMTRLPDLQEELTSRKAALDAEAIDTAGERKRVARLRDEIRNELESLATRTSNLPIDQVELREQLCDALNLAADELPFAGELIDVTDTRAEWRGAAERVLRGFALSLLVPQRHYDDVTTWVNSRRLTVSARSGSRGARLVYERVPARHLRMQPPVHDHLVLSDCLDVKDGDFHDYIVAELWRRADYRCADSIGEFRSQRRAVTREGQVRSGERHTKDDRHRVDDPRRWVLGWANQRKIEALAGELADLDREHERISDELRKVTDEQGRSQSRLNALIRLGEVRGFADIDVAEAESRAAEHEAERVRLQAGSSRLDEIEQALAGNERMATELAKDTTRITSKLATLQADLNRAEAQQRSDTETVSAVTADELADAREMYPRLESGLGAAVPRESSACANTHAQLVAELTQRIERLGKEIGGLGQSLVSHMGQVLDRWPELRSEMDASAESRHDFVRLRDAVADNDLPRFEQQFKDALHKNAIHELAGFNNWLSRQASAIDDRVARINEGLRAVPYNPGRYIRLEKQRTTRQDIVQFREDLRNLTNDALAGDDQYSEQRFLDVKRILERFQGREGYAESDRAWTRRVTDVRNWFVFSASEREEADDVEWEHYSDADGKSGGQKEKLAYTILAASLAYQFDLEWGATKSRDFRFAVIDEAFGRGSDVSTRYALDLFAKLGLQLLIVTPLQKVHVIEPYVRAIGFVDNPTGTDSRLRTMTIEQYREQRGGGLPATSTDDLARATAPTMEQVGTRG